MMDNNQVNDMLKKFKPEEIQKIQSLLKDKQAAEKILASPQAQELMKQFFGQ